MRECPGVAPRAIAVNAVGEGCRNAVGVVNEIAVGVGMVVGSVPDISFVILNGVFFQEATVFVLEGNLAMMFLLVGDVTDDGGLVARADGKRAVTRLPVEATEPGELFVNPLGGTGFDFLDQIGYGDGARQREKQMDVVGHGIGGEEITTAAPDDAANVAMKLVPPEIIEQRRAVLGAENQVNENIGEGLRHGFNGSAAFRVLDHRLYLPTGQSSQACASRRWDAHRDFRLPLGERVRDVFEEDQAEHSVLVNRGVEIGPQLVGGGPELLIELAEEGLGVGMRHQEIFDWRLPIRSPGGRRKGGKFASVQCSVFRKERRGIGDEDLLKQGL